MDYIIKIEEDSLKERTSKNKKEFFAITIPQGFMIKGKDYGGWNFLVTKVEKKSIEYAEMLEASENTRDVILPSKWTFELKKQQKELYGGFTTLESIEITAEGLYEAYKEYTMELNKKTQRLNEYNQAYDEILIALDGNDNATKEDLDLLLKQQKAYGKTAGYNLAIKTVAELLGYDEITGVEDMLGYRPNFDEPSIFVDAGKCNRIKKELSEVIDSWENDVLSGLEAKLNEQIETGEKVIESLWKTIEKNNDYDRPINDGNSKEYIQLRREMEIAGFGHIVENNEIPDCGNLDIVFENEKYTFYSKRFSLTESIEEVYNKKEDSWLSYPDYDKESLNRLFTDKLQEAWESPERICYIDEDVRNYAAYQVKIGCWESLGERNKNEPVCNLRQTKSAKQTKTTKSR